MYLGYIIMVIFEIHCLTKIIQRDLSSKSRASAQSKRSNENPKRGCWGEDGQRQALTIVKTSGSQAHVANIMLCSSLTYYIKVQTSLSIFLVFFHRWDLFRAGSCLCTSCLETQDAYSSNIQMSGQWQCSWSFTPWVCIIQVFERKKNQ